MNLLIDFKMYNFKVYFLFFKRNIDRLKFFYPSIKHVRMVAEDYYAAIFYK